MSSACLRCSALKERRQTAGTLSAATADVTWAGDAVAAKTATARRTLDGRATDGAEGVRDRDRDRYEGVTILLIEQNAKLALEVSDRGYAMKAARSRCPEGGRSLDPKCGRRILAKPLRGIGR
jgi:hypothetical protein